MNASDPPPTADQAAKAEPLLSGPKRQHFLPRFYLEGFAEEGLLAVYDRESDKVRVQQPVNTGVIGHFYTIADSEGRRRFELEQLLSEFESKASPAIKKLAARVTPTDDERSDLAIFVALAGFRTPDIVDSLKLFNSGVVGDMAKAMFSDIEQVKEQMRGKPGAPASEQDLQREAAETVEFAQSDQYRVTTSHRWAVAMAFEMAMKVAPLLAGRNWLITHRGTERASFVTTDSPVVLNTLEPRAPSPWGVGFGNADAVVLFPLTQSCAVVIFGEDGNMEHREVDTVNVRAMNLAVADRCQRFVIGRDEALVRSLADRLGLGGKKWRPKMQKG